MKVPYRQERHAILTEVHAGHGHFGQEATWARLSNQYWWPTDYADAKSYEISCHECQTFAALPRKSKE